MIKECGRAFRRAFRKAFRKESRKVSVLSIADAAKRANIERSVFEKEYMAYMK